MKINKWLLSGAILLAFGAQANEQKLATYGTMRDLATQINGLKGRALTSEETQRLSDLRSQFDALSRSMGGDDPTRMYEATRAAGSPFAPNGSGPTPPPGMTVTTTSATNNTPVAIADVAVSTSTVTIAGADPFTWDIDLSTSITHTFAADMDITLTSPAGTVVTLSTDNGAGNDNVFNGTFWDDDANPAGQVPFTTNNGVVTDQAYVNLTTATPLVAEESLGAFRGENPNGIWTLTVSDDLAGDVGSIDAWTLDVHGLTASPTLTTLSHTNNTPVAIADVAVSTMTINVTGHTGVITDMTVLTNLAHTFAADMDVTLQSPAGTVVTFSTDNGAGNDNVYVGTTFDDGANPAGALPYTTNNGVTTDHAYVNLTAATPLVVEESLSAFTGEDPNGNWTLSVSDDLAGDTGSIDLVTLNITTGTAPCSAIVCPANITTNTAAGVCNAAVTFAAPTGDPGCGVITCDATSGGTFGLGATTVNCTAAAGPTCNFSVTVADAEAPVLTCPTNIVTQPTSVAGATVNFTAPVVTDNCPGAAAATCVPPSGSIFPTGTTNVACSAADAAATTGACSFSVLVGAQTAVPIFHSLGLFGLIALVMLIGWARRQSM